MTGALGAIDVRVQQLFDLSKRVGNGLGGRLESVLAGMRCQPVEGGIIAMHDTIRKKGPKKVLWENIFRSSRFQDIAIVDNITATKKVATASLRAQLKKWLTIALRGIYIAARKSRVPRSKPIGRLLLKKLTVQSWLPLAVFIFSLNIAR